MKTKEELYAEWEAAKSRRIEAMKRRAAAEHEWVEACEKEHEAFAEWLKRT